ncbi:MAG: cohesin domain-containing protein [Desulfobulbaceae bacterium]|nr:cohesin domain-containing protein [Desulfobulbaceae bacterium]
MPNPRHTLLFSIIGLLLTLAYAHPSQAELSARLRFVPTDEKDPGQFSLVIDRAEKLAGMKVTLSYDSTNLSFVKAKKAPSVSSFMHVVNDKIPGTVIIVMASATGISGTDVELLHLYFKQTGNNPKSQMKVSVIQTQLMNENLQEISTDTPEYLF